MRQPLLIKCQDGQNLANINSKFIEIFGVSSGDETSVSSNWGEKGKIHLHVLTNPTKKIVADNFESVTNQHQE